MSIFVNYLKVLPMYITLSILALSAFFFINGKLRSDLVALCALMMLVLFHILTPEEALSGFSNSVVIMMIGLFVVGGAIFQTGLAKMISSKLLKMAGGSELKLFILVILVTAVIGAFVSNTGTVALMLPIVVSLAMEARLNASRFLMPLAFASSMGGMMTLIGTPPNLVINNTLLENGFEGLTFFSFAPIGVICVLVGVLALIPLSKKYLSRQYDEDEAHRGNKKSLKELANEYRLSKNLYRVRLSFGSLLSGHKVQDLDLVDKYGLTILEVRRDSAPSTPFFKMINQRLAGPDTILQELDILYVLGDYEKVVDFASEFTSELLDVDVTEDANSVDSNKLLFHEIGIAEILLMPTSSLVGKEVKISGFREKYSINILGIQRKNEYIVRDLKDQKMRQGDVLLVQGTWENIARLSEEQLEWVVLGQPLAEASKVTLDHKAPLAAGIMFLMIVSMMFDFIPVSPVVAVMVAAILMVLTGCIRSVEAAYKTINWESVVLIAAMLPMSLALEKTGASVAISGLLVHSLGNYGPIVLLGGIYLTTSVLTMFISNTATAVLLAPIALMSALQTGSSPYPFLFAVAIASSMCFASPFSTPPNALVMPVGRYTFMDYIKVGLPLQVLMGIVMLLFLPLLFPF